MGLQYEMKWGTPQHDKVSHALWSRYQFSYRYMSQMYPNWVAAENLHRAYVDSAETDEQIRKAEGDSGEPEYATLKIPYSYSMLLAAHTYWTTIFLSRDPIIQFTGRHGESEQKTQAVESLLAYQTLVGKHLVPYYVWLFDVGKYGIGILGHYWEKEVIQSSEIIETQAMYAGIPIEGQKKKQRRITQIPGYQGTKVYNVRPFDFFPDPRVPMQRFQDGEYCGRLISVGWNTILKRRAQGLYFNIDELEKRTRTTNIQNEQGSPQIVMPAMDNTLRRPDLDIDKGFVEIMEMYVELAPKEWGVGTSMYLEKWVFTLADMRQGRALIIGAQPHGELHGKFPFSILECEVDGYALLKRGFYDILEPLQNTMDWLFNTHFYNMRRAINDMVMIDPSRVNIKDFLEPEPGKLIRALPSAYGTDIRTAAFQFSIQDVTRMNLQDSEAVGMLMQRTLGVTDQIMGLMNSGGRKSATEVRQANAFGVNRLKTQGEYFSASGWAPNAEMLLATTQQHYSQELVVRIAGDLLNTSGSLKVSPEMISGFFDFVPVDGNLPIDRFAQVNLWTQLLGQMRQFPTVMAGYDMLKVFSWVAQLAGLKNINQFKVKIQPDSQIEQEAQKGNITPLVHGAAAPRPDFPEDVASGNLGPPGL